MERVKGMNAALVHRGPDGEGYFPGCSDNERHHEDSRSCIGLGHRRLAIIDLATGDQPMGNEDGTVWVVFNGEIYNFLDLRRALEAQGHRFRTRSDTEVIVHAWEQWAEKAVEKFRGMFALAVWDERRRSLFLARDRLGKKPLYYALTDQSLVFASELKALLRGMENFSGDIDLEALDAYLSYGYVPSPLSIFPQVRKLEPAHWALCTPELFKLHCYWHLVMNDEVRDRKESEVIEELQFLFDEAVRRRLISDVPLGAFLSGGVDSSAVVASMALQSTGEPVKTASIGFQEQSFNELEFARRVARRYGTDHTEFTVTPDALSILDRIVWHLDEPFADSSAIPTWYVSQMARRTVTVALSGDGGDEVFAGYAMRYAMCRLEDQLRSKTPEGLRKAILKPMGKLYPRVDRWPRPFRLKKFLQNLSLPMEQAYSRDMAFYFKDEDRVRLYRPEIQKKRGAFKPKNFLLRHFFNVNSTDAVTRAQYVDIKTYLPEDILVKVDRMSMAHALEVRAPLLDHELIEWAGKLSSRYKLNGKISKYILKKMNEKRLPYSTLYRKKQGFVVPLAQWLRGPLRHAAQDLLFGADSGLSEYFQMPYVRELWKAHQNGRHDNAGVLWALMMFEKWRHMVCRPSSTFHP